MILFRSCSLEYKSVLTFSRENDALSTVMIINCTLKKCLQLNCKQKKQNESLRSSFFTKGAKN